MLRVSKLWISTLLMAFVAFGCGGGGGDTTDEGTQTDTPLADSGSDEGTVDEGSVDEGTPSDPGQPNDPGQPEDTYEPFAITPGTAQEELEIMVGNDVRYYRLFVPADYDASTPTPVLFQMHSYSNTHSPEKQAIYASSDRFVTDNGYILVQPRANWNGSGYGWLDSIGKTDSYIRDLHDFLASELNFDAERTFLLGTGDSAKYVSRATNKLGDVFSGFALLDGAQKSTPNVDMVSDAQIYLSSSLASDYTLTYVLNFADALEADGRVPGQDFALRVYPGSLPTRPVHVGAALAWLDPATFVENTDTTAVEAPFQEVELPSASIGTTNRITAFAGTPTDGIVAVGLRGKVLHRAEDGTWTHIADHPHANRDFYTVCFDGTDSYWVGGTEHAISVGTTPADPAEGGLSFAKVTNVDLTNDTANRTPGIVGIDCGGDEVWIGGTSDVSVTQDGGDTWKTKEGFVPKPASGSGRIIDIARDAQGQGFLLALDGTVYRSTDYGYNWSEAQPDFEPEDWWLLYVSNEGSVAWEGMAALAAPGNGLATVVGRAGVIRYRDVSGGWSEATLPEGVALTTDLSDGTNEIFDVHYFNETVGCAAGGSGLLLHTTDGGLNWVHVETGLSDDLSAVYCTDTAAWVAGKHGKIFSGSLTGE